LKMSGKSVYAMVTGLGLGVWKKTPEQSKLYLRAFQNVIKRNELSRIAVIDFR